MAASDFNAVIFILDTLSEDDYSFVELADYVGRTYGRDIITESLRMLCERGLIAFFANKPGKDRNVRDNSRIDVDDFFVIAQRDRETIASHFIELTNAGRQVLTAFGVGVL